MMTLRDKTAQSIAEAILDLPASGDANVAYVAADAAILVVLAEAQTAIEPHVESWVLGVLPDANTRLAP